ncbi:putative outer membrane lipoprotein [bacterium YEK0313]|nr:putative outer membrane lipoprotein [bacterium YEK0313]
MPGQPPVPGQQVPAPGQQRPGVPGQPIPGQPVPGQPVPGQPVPGQPVPGQPGGPGAGQPGQPGFGQQPGQPGFGQRPGQPGQPGFTQGQPRQPGYVAPQPGYGGYPGGYQQPRTSGSRIGPAGALAIGGAAGLVGGFLVGRGTRDNGIDDIRRERREQSRDGVMVIQEPGRTIVRDGDGYFLRHDETERFRDLGGNFRSERRGGEFYSVYDRPGGVQIVTVTDEYGQLRRRVRRYPDGREVVLIENYYGGQPRSFDEQVVELPPPRLDIPQERYIVDTGVADERTIYETLTAPPVAPLPRRYTLDEVRYSPAVRAYTRSVDINTINFDTGSWAVSPGQVQQLATVAQAINQAVQRNPAEVFLIEGHTDAVGSDVDNLSLSDRRAQSVATILTRDFNVPPENLTSQGYGSQYPKVQTQGASRENRRVTVRRITDLLAQQQQQLQQSDQQQPQQPQQQPQ